MVTSDILGLSYIHKLGVNPIIIPIVIRQFLYLLSSAGLLIYLSVSGLTPEPFIEMKSSNCKIVLCPLESRASKSSAIVLTFL